mmetsp:Transcript_61403/g.168575  ORF Transcript_61403/g.168575 Transcript_61403/m.168575 type:complete len:530 (-) Transcript_61403:189-1778(-)|eukprot:CAMPEP_0119480004 /NCGR_PEP_ID=MMETSP1344-20130328/9010_1 /TAXON_ID=236787 /ORGANISM="Florenciella parvula, Strain CCMP2471" /LENGTH=529 /DNA_ID=CAMNT_0007514283 /DNA_START=278 /DNA_END=1867 /DNA_ORIENTATION=+
MSTRATTQDMLAQLAREKAAEEAEERERLAQEKAAKQARKKSPPPSPGRKSALKGSSGGSGAAATPDGEVPVKNPGQTSGGRLRKMVRISSFASGGTAGPNARQPVAGWRSNGIYSGAGKLESIGDGWTDEDWEGANRDDVLMRIRLAMDDANTAVQMDRENDDRMALRFYTKTVVVLIQVITYLELRGHEKKDKETVGNLQGLVSSYRSRIAALKEIASQKMDRRQSHVAFQEIEELDLHENATGPEEPKPTIVTMVPFYHLRLIRQSILFGGYVSAKVFIPKEVWRQHNAKFTGLSTKVSAFEELLFQICHSVVPVELPSKDSDAEGWQRALTALNVMLEHLHKSSVSLARSFNYLEASEKDTSAEVGESGVEKGHYLKMFQKGAMDVLKTTVVNPTLTAYKRVEAAVPGRITTEALAHYAELVAEVCLKSQVFDVWLKRVGADGSSDDSATAVPSALLLKQKVRKCLLEVSKIFHDVMCEMIWRDLQRLLERYLRKMRKSFARMYWDDDIEDDDTTSLPSSMAMAL